jgi:predicted transposase YdaD
LFCYSFTAIGKAIGEAAEEEEEEEEKFVLVLRILALELTRIMKSSRFSCHL